MKQYFDLLSYVKNNGIKKEDRTGTGTLSVFGYQMRFDLNKGFPLLTTKKIHLKSLTRQMNLGQFLYWVCLDLEQLW